jgi:hypothetical protein
MIRGRYAPGASLVVLIFTAICARSFSGEGSSQEYQIILVSDGVITIEGQKQNVTAQSQIDYTNKIDGPKVEVFCDAMCLTAKQDGKIILSMKADKTAMSVTSLDGKKVEFTSATGTEEQRKRLQDQFACPLVTLEVDASGNETKRTPSSADGAQSFIQTGAIQNLRMFHVPYLPTQDKWSSKVEISGGNGGYVAGDLNFEKTTSDGNVQTVRVSGSLTNKKFDRANNMSVRNAVYEVQGSQNYDKSAKKWSSAKWDVKLKCDMFHNDDQIGDVTGTMQLELISKQK